LLEGGQVQPVGSFYAENIFPIIYPDTDIRRLKSNMNKIEQPRAKEPRTQKTETPSRKPVYVYHWNRIIGVLILLAFVIGASGYALFGWLAMDDVPQQQISERESESVAIPASMEPSLHSDSRIGSEPDEKLREHNAPPRQASPLAVVDEPEPSQNPVPEPKTVPAQVESTLPSTLAANRVVPSTTPPDSAETVIVNSEIGLPAKPQISQQVSDATPHPASTPQIAAQTMPLKEQPGAATKETTTEAAEPEPGSGPFKLQQLQILNPQVKRFLLPRTVINKEPRGEIDEIRLKSDGSAAIWCYSEVIDRRGSELFYVWFHEGRRLARVRIKVNGDRWRSYSSKVINQRYRGNWRVELQDSAERLLASAEFALR